MGEELVAEQSTKGWRLVGPANTTICNEYLAHLADRHYSPATVRAYAFDLLHFAR
jgi:hypothetical protein